MKVNVLNGSSVAVILRFSAVERALASLSWSKAGFRSLVAASTSTNS